VGYDTGLNQLKCPQLQSLRLQHAPVGDLQCSSEPCIDDKWGLLFPPQIPSPARGSSGLIARNHLTEISRELDFKAATCTSGRAYIAPLSPLANDKWSILPSPQIPFLLLVLQDSFNRTTWLNLQITDWKETYVQLYNVVAIMSDIVPCKKTLDNLTSWDNVYIFERSVANTETA